MFGPFRKREPAADDPAATETTGEPGAAEPGAAEAAVAPAEAAAAGATPQADVEPPAPASGDAAASAADDGTLEERIVEALKSIYDPEIPVNIYELGLIYDVALPDSDDGKVGVKMTLTSPHCPVAESLPGDVKRRVEAVEGVREADVEVVWDPAWNPDMMSEAAKLELGFF